MGKKHLNEYSQLSTLRFKRDVIQLEKINQKTGETNYDYRVVIKLVNIANNRGVIHGYTEFINQWRSCSTKTSIDVCDYIIPFINYLTFELSEEVLPSIHELTFEHGAEYLSKYGESRSRTTVLACDRVISKFYYFLAKKTIINNIDKSHFSFVLNKNRKLVMLSPFSGMYTLPKTYNKKPLHYLDEELIFDFIYTAVEIVPQIALGVYWELFGGLRISEVVNIKYSDISLKGPYGRNGMVITLRKSDLRPDLKRNATTSPKKPRNQPIISISDILSLLYERHIKLYRNSLTDAVFIDNNGQAMSKDTYRYNFDKLKRAFINKLKSSDIPQLKLYSAYLNTQKWSTHLCRGIFSNLIADIASNTTEIAVWRGDSSLDSALAYVSDSRKIEKKLQLNMNKFYIDRYKRNFEHVLSLNGGD